MKFTNNGENRKLLKDLGYTRPPSSDSTYHRISTHLRHAIELFWEETNEKFTEIDAIEFNNALRDNFLDEGK